MIFLRRDSDETAFLIGGQPETGFPAIIDPVQPWVGNGLLAGTIVIMNRIAQPENFCEDLLCFKDNFLQKRRLHHQLLRYGLIEKTQI